MADQPSQRDQTPDDEFPIPPAARYEPGPLTPILAVYYLLLTGAGVALIALAPDLREAGVLVIAVALGLAPIALHRARTQSAPPADLRPVMRALEHAAKRMSQMAQEGGLSEAAKRVLHRREEREMLRREIEQDIADGDFEAAMVLVRELAERFGYRADAEEFRAKINRVRLESLDRTVSDAVERLDALISERRWEDAYDEAARIQRLYPDSPRVDTLRDRVDQARGRYKLDLERRFLHAAQRDEVDRAMDLLKQLDQYLTETEAEKLREVARGVVSKARENLGARFKLLVEDAEWAQAVGVGERIMRDFPNTRMAEEVREMIDTLRARASGDTPQAASR
ncbi:MAG: hypothetical protein D6693_06685 [Planctomycetota bacterium]|nr:MAG: hypothetical protein D6693_06685 [Planctomycetota bacterium]